MAIENAYTYEEAKEMLTLWKKCETALATGQAKAYKVGTREYTALDLDEISRRITYWSNLLDAKSGTVRTSKVTRVVPRDL